MEFSASNIKNGTFNVDLSVTEESFEDAIFYYCLGLTRVTAEFITTFSTDKKEATALHRIINKMCKKMTNDFLDGPFSAIKEACTEENLYRYMQQVFDDWLHESDLSKEAFEQLYAGSETLYMEPTISKDEIKIHLSNGSEKVMIRKFYTDVVKDKSDFEKEVDMAYIVSVIAGDILFGDEKNPIREKYCAGDKALMESIRSLLK